MNFKDRLEAVKANLKVGRITLRDMQWMASTIEEQQKELEELRIVKAAYEAYKKAH